MLTVLHAGRVGEAFPPLDRALTEPDGLLAMGGDLSPERLQRAYRQGIFPWYSAGQPILWWSPDPRTVLFPEKAVISRSMAKVLRRGRFELSWNRAFGEVVEACADPSCRADAAGTWITPEMQSAYNELHRLGLAHSAEAWEDGRLVGGLYGVAIGRVFFGESMFHRVSNASKAAFLYLMGRLRDWNYALVDCQAHTPHLESLGAESIPRSRFAWLLESHCDELPAPDAWQEHDRPAAAALR
ncbi:leucyl/phenylalanyl-tRNA--protein transferase [Methylogaea oryzae]|uniref:Leucyl/phenylalanyl-tRNA--protein transferase n=1 Tax=Methylogaea oryzae TaxID=1295382 RepID=A0A8D5AHG5_9GAMM|nr:leucyl/phenylalanyl-tRNA--protein transferase [Methylogaea oryzae]BBL70256.1 leucyl/phenylalanyl-tRNA--protein transferase [Methylogaea oryzae]